MARPQRRIKTRTRPESLTAKVKKRQLRELLSDASPFSVEMLRELLAGDVLGRKLKMPTDAKIEELVRVLNFWRSHYQEGQIYRPLNQRKKKARDALAALKTSCAILRDDTQRQLASATEDAAPSGVLEILARRLDEIGAMEKSIAIAENYSVIADHDNYVGERWPAVEGALIEDFHNAMSPANPQLKLALSHNGPLARFFAAIVPFLTGEHPTPGSVATQLKARKKGI
jgi:hypothetical protein